MEWETSPGGGVLDLENFPEWLHLYRCSVILELNPWTIVGVINVHFCLYHGLPSQQFLSSCLLCSCSVWCCLLLWCFLHDTVGQSRSRSRRVVPSHSRSRSPRNSSPCEKSPHSQSSRTQRSVSPFVAHERLLCEELECLQRILHSQARHSSTDRSKSTRPTRKKQNASPVDTGKFSRHTESASRVSPVVTGKSSRHTESEGVQHDGQIQSGPAASAHCTSTQKSPNMLAATTDSIHCKSSMSSATDASLDSASGALETGKKFLFGTSEQAVSVSDVVSIDNTSRTPEAGEKLFSSSSGDYKGDSDLAVTEHCVHRATWQDDGNPLRDFLAQQSFFARLRKQRLESRQHVRKALCQKSTCKPTAECVSQSRDDSQQQHLTLSGSKVDKKNGRNVIQMESAIVSSSATSSSHNSVLLTDIATSSSPYCTSASPCTNSVDSLSFRDQPLQASLMTMSEPTSDVNSVQGDTFLSTSCGSHTGSIKRPLPQGTMLVCPNCEYFTSNLADIRLHCIRRHTLEWQGKDLPLREPDNIPVKRSVVADQSLACPKCKYVTANLADIRLHCIRRHSLEWQGKGLPLRKPGSIPAKRSFQVPLAEKSSEFEEHRNHGKTDQDASTSIQPAPTATLFTTADSSAGDISAGDATFLSSVTLSSSTSTEQPVLQPTSTTTISPSVTTTTLWAIKKEPTYFFMRFSLLDLSMNDTCVSMNFTHLT